MARKLFSFIGVGIFLLLMELPGYAHAAPFSSFDFTRSILMLVNGDRAAQNASPLSVQSALSKAAQAKADDMASKGYFAHYSPDGTSPWHWFSSAGYSYTHAGENLAINFDDPATVELAWMNSPLHRANILKGVYTQTGIGVAKGMYLGKPATFIVQLFATPSAPKNMSVTSAVIAAKVF